MDLFAAGKGGGSVTPSLQGSAGANTE
jgi:hypothetical protein